MRRTPLVLAGTVVGLLGVLMLPLSSSKPTVSTLPATNTTGGSGGGSGSGQGAGTSGRTGGTGGTGSTVSTATRSATGAVANYYYGTLSVTVTATGSKITSVSIASLNDGGNSYSAYVDGQSIPLLKQQAIAAQNANIQGVSGASYTSSGFQQSLQSALGKLGL